MSFDRQKSTDYFSSVIVELKPGSGILYKVIVIQLCDLASGIASARV